MGSKKSTVSDLHAAILAQLTEGVIVADAQGQITYVNEAAERLHGVAKLGVPPSGYSDIRASSISCTSAALGAERERWL
jgi:PAS domain-containing protein